uniref:uncharacterized protein LOC120340186 n=1 Tax=Styela clava TaxID=7725 RepID=UPI00193ABA7B|nr:uncharacterized protein LOC120340186 [Styela clava]
MSHIYGNVEPPEETNENVYEDYINPTASSGATRQDDAGEKNSESKNRKISWYNIAISTAVILSIGLASCGMIFAVQNNNRIQKLMEALEVKIENITTKVMHNHGELEMKMVTMDNRIRKIDTETNLIRVNHEESEQKIENLTIKVMRNHEELKVKMLTMEDHMRDIDTNTNLIRINHKDFSSSVKNSIDTMKLTLHHIESLEYPVAVRLVGGNITKRSGRVEVRYNDIWGTICDDGWGQEESNVVCHMLGFGNASRYYSSAHFGTGYGKIWLDDVKCTGIESDITWCRHIGWGNHNCGHGEDVSVACDSVPES